MGGPVRGTRLHEKGLAHQLHSATATPRLQNKYKHYQGYEISIPKLLMLQDTVLAGSMMTNSSASAGMPGEVESQGTVKQATICCPSAGKT